MLATRLIRTAVVFFVAGVTLGTAMGALHDFRLAHVHAHLNLLGWVSLCLIGLLYSVQPRLGRGVLAHAHYWLHTVGLVLFKAAFAWSALRGEPATAAVAIGASMVTLAVLLFAIHVGLNLRAPAAAATAP